LLSIRPQYAEAIFRGEKRFEFRRTVFRKSVDVVVVYITNPVGMVVGEFDVEEIISDDVSGLWSRTNAHAGINRKLFFEYFAGCELAHAIVIGGVRRYKRPLELQKTFGVRAPQSFLYLANDR
jgi:predicted transcriptional regulator